jgi:hypothetical protein
MTMTIDQMIQGTKRLATTPQNQLLLSPQALLDIADRNLNDAVLPEIDAVNQEFFVTKTTTQIVSGTSEYAIPTRAMGRKLREIKLVNSSGGRFDFPMVPIEREHLYRANGIPFGFFFYGDKVKLVPEPATSGFQIEFWWFLPPGIPIFTSSAAKVVSVVGDDVTVSTVPGSLTVGATVDFVEGSPGNSYLGLGKEILSIAGNTLSFDVGAVPTDLTTGDYLCPEGYSCIVQLPKIAAYYWQSLNAKEMLFSLGDFEGYERLAGIADKQLKNMQRMLEPRIEGEPTVIINDRGLVRGPRRGIYSGWFLY